MKTQAPPRPEGVSCRLMLITPSLAKKWLQYNTKNRNPKPKVVEAVARDIAAGNWVVNGQTIVFDSEGTMIDGQHRLEAVLASGIPVWCIVVKGVDPCAFVTIDNGTARNFGDVCTINGEKHATLLAATTRLLWRYESDRILDVGAKASTSMLEDFLEEHPGLRDSVLVGYACQKVCQPSVVAFSHYVFNQVDPFKARQFFASLETGANLRPRSPVLHLRNRLQEDKLTKHQRLSAQAKVYLVFRAWAAYRDSAPMQRLQLPRSGDLTPPEPCYAAA